MQNEKNKHHRRNKGKMSLRKKIILGTLAGMLLLVFSVVIYGYIKLDSIFDDSIPIVTKGTEQTREPEPSLDPIDDTDEVPEDLKQDSTDEIGVDKDPIYKQPSISKDVVNVLLIGDDTRNINQRGRSDSMMLISYNEKTKQIYMTSFLRDIWVYIEGRGYNRLNAAYAFGGPGLLINTINDNFGLDIQNYVVGGFSALVDVINILGGVEITLTKEEAAYLNKNPRQSEGYDLSPFPALVAGTQTINGVQALVHSRNRYVGSADFERVRRQKEVLFAAFSKLKKNPSISNVTDTINVALKNVKTNMKPSEIVSLGVECVTGADITFEQHTVPAKGTWKYAKIEGRSVVQVDLKKNEKLLKDLIYPKTEG